MGSELVKWKDSAGNETLLSLSHINVGIEQRFVSFAKMKLLADAQQWLDPSRLSAYISYLSSGQEFWNEGGMSQGVLGIFNSDEGAKYLVKMLFGESIKGLTNADFNTLYETSKDDKSSLFQAFQLVMKARYPEVEEYIAEKKSGTDPVTPDQPDIANSSPK